MKLFLLNLLIFCALLMPLASKAAEKERVAEILTAVFSGNYETAISVSNDEAKKHLSPEKYNAQMQTLQKLFGKLVSVENVEKKTNEPFYTAMLRFTNSSGYWRVRLDDQGMFITMQPMPVLPARTEKMPQKVELPKLDKLQMRADFDYMVDMLQQAYPFYAINKEVFGIDTWETLARYRNKITGCESLEMFYEVLTEALIACKGNHTWIRTISPRSPQMLKNYANFIEPSAYAVTAEVAKNYNKMPRRQATLELCYFEGSYYNLYSFEHEGRSYPAGMKLVRFDGREPARILPELQDHLTDYDYTNKIFYGSYFSWLRHNFYVLLPEKEDGRQEFIFEDSQSGIHTIKISPAVIPCQKKSSDILLAISKQILYLPDSKVLYIRIPTMEHSDLSFYLNEIEKLKNLEFRGVILDIRGNPGGNDSLWVGILEKLLAEIVTVELQALFRDSNMMFRYISRHLNLDEAALRKQAQSITPKDIPFHTNEKFCLWEMSFPILPRKDSLQIKAPVFILSDNIYSSSGALTAAARCSPNITWIGLDNPMSLGRSFSPFAFSLPYSKLIVAFTPSIDITWCKNAEDTLHVHPEVALKLTLEDFLTYLSYPAGKNLYEFLTRKDPFMRKALELIAP